MVEEVLDLDAAIAHLGPPPVGEPGFLKVLRELDDDERLSLRHWRAWARSNGTVEAYNLHADVLRTTNREVLSLYRANSLVTRLCQIQLVKVDMCRNSCVAFTGPYEKLNNCPNPMPSKRVCTEDRWARD